MAHQQGDYVKDEGDQGPGLLRVVSVKKRTTQY